MSDDTLNLAVGATVQLQLTVPQNSPREVVRVIGYVPGGSLVVNMPSNKGNVKIVREGQIYKARMLLGDSVVGFEAKVLFVSLKPYPHMHLQYPKEFAQIIVRDSARVRTEIPCTVRDVRQPGTAENHHQARIVDLSETGAKIASDVSLGSPGDMLQLSFKLELLGVEETLNLVGKLRNQRERLDKDEQPKQRIHLHGLQFRAVNRIQQILLHAWVMERIVTAGTGDAG
jgi:c-di-GMP-binding flagellar brake protein YcgR